MRRLQGLAPVEAAVCTAATLFVAVSAAARTIWGSVWTPGIPGIQAGALLLLVLTTLAAGGAALVRAVSGLRQRRRPWDHVDSDHRERAGSSPESTPSRVSNSPNLRRTSIALGVPLLALGIWLGMSPLRGGGPIVRARLLAHAPLGSSVDDVLSLAQRRRWEYGDTGPAARGQSRRVHYSGAQGVRFVHADLGRHYCLLRVDVDATWGFDGNDRLVTLAVRTMVDAP